MREVVLALGATVEAETTGALVRSLVNRRFPGVTVTRLAQGIPLGAEVKFMRPRNPAPVAPVPAGNPLRLQCRALAP